MSFFSSLLNKICSLPSFFIEMGQTFINGQRVLASEIKWLVVRLVRQLEIRQLEKLRQKEYTLLGEVAFKQLDTEQLSKQNEEVELSRAQLAFLEKEIDHLKQELATYRKNLITKRSENWQ